MSRCRPKGEDEPPAACRPTKSRVYKSNKVKSNVSTLSISDLKLFIELSSHRRLPKLWTRLALLEFKFTLQHVNS